MFNIKVFEELDSTNSYCKNNITSLNHFDVVFAKNQTKGRGRMSRSWLSSLDSLTFSILLKDKYSIDHFDTISLLTGAAIHRALSKYIKDGLSIKWPNDIYYKGQKLCGILLESVSYSDNIEGIIVGIGINVNNDGSLLSSLNNPSTSIYLITKQKYELIEVLNEVLNAFKELYLDVFYNGNLFY